MLHHTVISTLLHRAKAACSTTQHIQVEQEHLQNVLTRCKYPTWALNRIKSKLRAPHHPKESNKGTKQSTSNSSNSNKQRGYTVVPYTKGLSGESIKTVSRKHGIQVYFKGGKTIKGLLIAPKDKDPITKKSCVIYRFKCDRVECDEEYTGESSRTFGQRFKEHLKLPSQIYHHFNTTNHTTTLENVSTMEREDQNLMRLIKEAIYIRVNSPFLNKNIGKYHLPHIWDDILFNISELKIK